MYKTFGKEVDFKVYLHGDSDAGTRLLAIGEGMARLSVLCVEMNVRVLYMFMGVSCLQG